MFTVAASPSGLMQAVLKAMLSPLLDVRLREYTEKGLDGHNLEKLRDYVAETY